MYLLEYSHAPKAWIDALERDTILQQCREELLRARPGAPWHVPELLGGKFERLSDPCTLDARVLGFEKLDKPPKVFVRPVEVYRGLMDSIWKDLPPLAGGTGTGSFRQELAATRNGTSSSASGTNRHIFVSEDMFREVKRIEAELPLELPPELPQELLAAEVDGVRAMRPREKKPEKQTWELEQKRFELTVFSMSMSFPTDKTCSTTEF